MYNFKSAKWSKPKIANQSIIPKIDSHCAVVIGSSMYIYGGYIANEGVLMRNIYSFNF
jgi:hypothetical protein